MSAPVLQADLYGTQAVEDSREVFARIREAGPVVWLPRHGMFAMGRFDDVRAALRDDETFASGRGVAANGVANRLGRHTTLSSDASVHVARRRVLMRSLGAKAITAVEGTLRAESTNVVASMLGRGEFETTRDFASHLPVHVVADLVGVQGGSERLLRWAAATFQGLGPLNRRALSTMAHSLGLWVYTQRLDPGAVRPESWAASVFEAQRSGALTSKEARALVIDFVAPSLDTTILATTHLVWAMAENPEIWDQIRADPSLIPAAVVENVRLASPIRGFTRTLMRDVEIDGTAMPAGARVALLFGAANLDETHFPDPTRFCVTRPSGAHLGWGNGPHTCVGIHLAKLEMRLLLEAMVPTVERVRAGPPVRLRNNTLQGIARLPASFVAAA